MSRRRSNEGHECPYCKKMYGGSGYSVHVKYCKQNPDNPKTKKQEQQPPQPAAEPAPAQTETKTAEPPKPTPAKKTKQKTKKKEEGVIVLLDQTGGKKKKSKGVDGLIDQIMDFLKKDAKDVLPLIPPIIATAAAAYQQLQKTEAVSGEPEKPKDEWYQKAKNLSGDWSKLKPM